jgi:2-amino-4-hydroxy-6-hydroxymethyldihydropteridine diphosphokinase
MKAAVGIGSNVGDRLGTMRAAVARVARGAEVLARSRVYETEPVGGPPQGPFLNAAILVDYNGSPLALLDDLLAVEAELGRTREVRWGPRAIDLDLLWAEGLIVDEPRLVVPHPRLAGRAFALAPLLDVAPHARDPRTGEPYVAPDDPGVRATDLTL